MVQQMGGESGRRLPKVASSPSLAGLTHRQRKPHCDSQASHLLASLALTAALSAAALAAWRSMMATWRCNDSSWACKEERPNQSMPEQAVRQTAVSATLSNGEVARHCP